MDLRRSASTDRGRVFLVLIGVAALIVAGVILTGGRAQAGLDLGSTADPGRAAPVAPPQGPERGQFKSDSADQSKGPERGHESIDSADQGTEHGAGTERKNSDEGKLAEVRNGAGRPLKVEDDTCAANMAIAANHGLRLPDGWELHCVGPGLDWDGNSHWGVTCRYDECPEGDGPYISISNPTYYVVAHELCHANFGDDELMADACAAERGASLATSPYS